MKHREGRHLARVVGAMIFGCVCGTASVVRADDDLGHAPSNCEELDRGLASDGPLSKFVVNGAAQTRTDMETLALEPACQLLRERSAFASGLIGMLSYCDNQQVLAVGTPNNVLYRRVGDAVRKVGNGLDDLMRDKAC